MPIIIEDQEQGFACADWGMGGCSWPPLCLPSSFPSLLISHPLKLVINVEEGQSTIPFDHSIPVKHSTDSILPTHISLLRHVVDEMEAI